MVKENEFLNACKGRNEEGEGRCGITCSLLLYDKENENEPYKEISTRSTKEAEFDIVRVGNLIQISLIYKTAYSPDLKLFWSQLQTYGELLESYNRNEEPRFPICMFNVFPEDYSNISYMSFSGPAFWVLQPQYVGDEKCNVIRMLFEGNTFMLNDVPDDIDITDMEAEANRAYRVIKTEK